MESSTIRFGPNGIRWGISPWISQDFERIGPIMNKFLQKVEKRFGILRRKLYICGGNIHIITVRMPKIFEYFGFLRFEEDSKNNTYKGKIMKNEVKTLYAVSAEDKGNFCIEVTFNDGHKSLVDIGAFIRQHPHPQYNKYLAPEEFVNFQIECGNVVWGEDWDLIFPLDKLYIGRTA